MESMVIAISVVATVGIIAVTGIAAMGIIIISKMDFEEKKDE